MNNFVKIGGRNSNIPAGMTYLKNNFTCRNNGEIITKILEICKNTKGYQHKGFPSGPPPQY